MSNEIELTSNQREFIGTTFPTHKGGVLTVTSVVGKCGKREGNAKFGLVCSVCSEDGELWPENSITSSKGGLVNGRIPCGCAKNIKWTEEQTRLRVRRECHSRGYIFHGWCGEYEGKNTHLDLENLKTGNRWQSTSIHSFMRGTGDPEEGKEKIRNGSLIDDKTYIQKFIQTGKFLEDVIFWRSDKKDSKGWKTYWNYTCPRCSKDEYVKSGLCSGIFEASSSNLKLGKLSCRCSDKYHWTQEQRRYQIYKIFTLEDSGEFVGWKDNHRHKSRYLKFKWICKEGHSCETTVKGFLSNNNRCSTCNKIRKKVEGGFYGYYHQRTEEQDNLYLIHFKSQNCIKIGRTFDVDRRVKELLKQSGCTADEIEILQILSGVHQQVYEKEQEIHGKLTELGFYHENSTWTTEAFDEDCLQLLYELVSESGLIPV